MKFFAVVSLLSVSFASAEDNWTTPLAAAVALFSLPLAQGAGDPFSYDPTAPNGPKLWPALATGGDENQCSLSSQSPVGINAVQFCALENAEYTFSGGTCAVDQLNCYNNDHSVECEYPEDGSCEPGTFTMPGIDGEYEITQFHTHTGSEHAFEGLHADFELHCVHKLKEGTGTGTNPKTGRTNTQAVVGLFVLVQGEADNDAFQPLLDAWQAYQDEVLASCGEGTVDGRKLVAAKRQLQAFDVYSLVAPSSFFVYSGSLTTPPCTEDLWWNIANDPVIISLAQGQQLKNIILDYRDESCAQGTGANPYNGWTSRPLQPLNGRTVSRYCLGTAADEGLLPPPSGSSSSGAALLPSMTWTASLFALWIVH